ncbi:hypothetical protein LO762_16510 [Actinocorallia sp. API 0066]|uniref:hypothetical protein n=1 Tax=Actinocorallia sp. API 0066 TaxID=2896846 RepID=UPI001E322907|nr:hypothetical protein [Actinocorallia sp. API 0066]MCD0450781.1 hypothetical protein [Actinocorallia sp. API 0066]
MTIVPSELGASEWQYHYEREDGSKQLPFRAGTGIVAEAVGGLLPMMRRLPYNHAEHMVAVAQMIHSQGWGQAGRHSSR